MTTRNCLLLCAPLAFASLTTRAVTVAPGELSDAREWTAAKFEGVQAAPSREPGIVVLANHDPVQKNSRNGRPMKLAGQVHNRGLYCHAFSKLIVLLPGPGVRFSAVVGVDSNEQTSGGRGSVDFSVNVGGAEKFRSGIVREGQPVKAVDVDLGGATEFILQVEETADGISCDQANWAEAKVTLKNGRELWLADLPLREGERQPESTEPPFSFTYYGKPSKELLPGWGLKRVARKLDDARTEHTLTWSDPQTKLVVRCVGIEYRDFPTVEWTLHFKNEGDTDTPILSDTLALDAGFRRGQQSECLLHHHAGSPATMDDYRPYQTPLGAKANLRLATSGGRGSDACWPYFNVDWGDEGVIVVVGWPGQWGATFARDEGRGVRIKAGQENTHFKLLPGEEVRSPLIVVQFWQGDWIRAQNVWRRWMIAHNIPRLNGKLPPALMPGGSSNQMNEMQNANEENQKQFIDGYLDNGVPISFWWMDAGWYPFKDGWWNTGTWEPDTKRFPNGLRAVTDHAHKRGVNALVWFEPERVQPGTWLYQNHPEWLLGKDGEQKLLDLGNDAARNWVIEHTDTVMREQGIDIYRQDFNVAPLGYWRAHDAPDRQGITEIKHVTGYLAFWDELRRHHPGLLIDTCASGGRRNDLETLRRSVPLHKSDMEYPNLTSKQTQFYGLAFWEPYFGAPVYPADRVDVYGFRSGIAMLTGLGYDSRRKDLDFALLRKLVAQRAEIVPNYYGDYYPLTRWSAEPDAWIAWQFDRPEEGKGVVQAFRRTNSIYESARLKMRGLDAGAEYMLTDLDKPDSPQTCTGAELGERGVLVETTAAPEAKVITYRKLN